MIKAIKLRQFRNHHSLTLEILSNRVFIFGENGLGKTSILESIYFASLAKSHRTTSDLALIEKDKPYAKMSIKTTKHDYEVVISETGTKAFIDKKQISKLSEYIGGYRVIMFAPEDLELIKGQPAIRRQFLDIEMTQIHKPYLFTLSKYKQILKQRNALLKNLTLKDDMTFFKIISEQLSIEADLIIEKRMKFIEKLNEAFKSRFKDFNEIDNVRLEYQPNVALKTLKQVLNDKKDKDILSQTTSFGPHRDELLFYFNEREAKTFASQGQQRLMVIALKLALLDIYDKEDLDTVLLLDDVLSELDQDKKQKLLNKLPLKHQTFISGVDVIEMKDIQKIELKKENSDGQFKQ
ncbi:MAG: DNA replication and repair protein RecF [Acholeplasma sp.]|jgi:DNA replication and repair protein RecF|nr:DNA replication and repair protein RecF [Acholeplasma sp.]